MFAISYPVWLCLDYFGEFFYSGERNEKIHTPWCCEIGKIMGFKISSFLLNAIAQEKLRRFSWLNLFSGHLLQKQKFNTPARNCYGSFKRACRKVFSVRLYSWTISIVIVLYTGYSIFVTITSLVWTIYAREHANTRTKNHKFVFFLKGKTSHIGVYLNGR